jgi:hypothetical protein
MMLCFLHGAWGAACLQNYWTYEAKPEYQFFDVSISMIDGSLQNDTVIQVARPLWVSSAICNMLCLPVVSCGVNI